MQICTVRPTINASLVYLMTTQLAESFQIFRSFSTEAMDLHDVLVPILQMLIESYSTRTVFVVRCLLGLKWSIPRFIFLSRPDQGFDNDQARRQLH